MNIFSSYTKIICIIAVCLNTSFLRAADDNEFLSPLSFQESYNFLPFKALNNTSSLERFQITAGKLVDEYDYRFSEMQATPAEIIQRSQDFSVVKTKSIHLIEKANLKAMKVENGEIIIVQDKKKSSTFLYSKWISDCTALAFKGEIADKSTVFGAAHLYPVYPDQDSFIKYLQDLNSYIQKMGISKREYIISYDPASFDIDIFDQQKIDEFNRIINRTLPGIKIYQREIVDNIFSSPIHFVVSSEGVEFIPVEIFRDKQPDLSSNDNIDFSS